MIKFSRFFLTWLLLITIAACGDSDNDTPNIEEEPTPTVPPVTPISCSTADQVNILTEGGLPSDFNNNELRIDSIRLPFPSLVGSFARDEVYVFGGQPFGLDLFVEAILTGSTSDPDPSYYAQFTPYISRVNPLTMETMTASLTGGAGLPYLGGFVKHPNGFLYAIAQARVFKIDPVDMSIVDFTDLPLPSSLAIYNGINITSNGRLISKSTIINNFGFGQLILLDADDLETVNSLDIEAGSARLTFECDENGNEYIYHLNQNSTFRIVVQGDTLAVDENWQVTYDPYGDGSISEPTSPRILGNKVLYTTNTSFSSTRPMKLFFQNTDRQYSLDDTPLEGFYMFADTESAGWDFSGIRVSPAYGIFIGQDQANGKIAAYSFNESNQLEYLWEKEYALSGTPFIAENTGMIYLNDYDAEQEADYLVILDIFNGNELGRIKTPGTLPSIGNLAVGANNDFYFSSNESNAFEGYFHRVSID